MKTSKIGRDAISSPGYEDKRLVAYKDSNGVWTVGVGHTGPEVVEGLCITDAQCDAYLEEDLKEAEDAINSSVKVPLTQCQFDALVSLTFNIGTNAFKKSTLLKKLNARDYEGAKKQFRRWVYDGGKVVTGLANRREKEIKMFG